MFVVVFFCQMGNFEQQLNVFEYGGTGRSGKGTVVGWLGRMHPEVTTDETGVYYRAVTFGLMEDGRLEPYMPDGAVGTVVKKTRTWNTY